MRDPKRIDKVLKVLKLVWSECPDLRLMQLLLNVLHKSDEVNISSSSVFYIEDEALIKAIAEYGLEFVKDETEDELLAESGLLDDLIKELEGAKKEKGRSFQDFFESWEDELEKSIIKFIIKTVQFEINFDTWFWYPYIMWGKYNPEEAAYYGHTWFIIIHMWILEFTILKVDDIKLKKSWNETMEEVLSDHSEAWEELSNE